ncbi:hypothetical protein DFH06DRAFT_1186197 [Mycena polygramma]|nr:hypothetical protein DFH06DRAFT_1186197 [Mycena polygramma]
MQDNTKASAKDIKLRPTRPSTTHWHSLEGPWQKIPSTLFLQRSSQASPSIHRLQTTTTLIIMPYPHRAQEPADARAALMANLASKSPLHIDRVARTQRRHLQAERPTPYRVLVRPKQSLTGECRKTRLLGWGAFLKDETLRTPHGTVVRAAQGPCPEFSLPCAKDPLSLWQEASIEGLGNLRRRRCTAKDDSALDCVMSSPDPPSTRPARDGDCEMPPWCSADDSPFELKTESHPPKWGHDAPESDVMGDLLCARAADEMFFMFIDEAYMEVIGEE